LNNKLANCPYCHQTVFKGAMRCVACGKILQTPEERIATIEKLQSKPKFNMKRFLKWIVTIITLGVLYYFFSERLIEIIKNTIGI
jgi:polyferredoxin